MDVINTFMNQVALNDEKGYSNYNSFVVNFLRDEFMVAIAEMRYLKDKHI